VVAYHLDELENQILNIDPTTLVDIFLGKITKWNDPAIQRTNSDFTLPDRNITVVHRADGSGTTWIFSNYLSKISEEWKLKKGNDNNINWEDLPSHTGAVGNDGVATSLSQFNGTIGYMELAYALQKGMPLVQLQNLSGHYVLPSNETFQAAAKNADWKAAKENGFFITLTNQPGRDSWPITGASFILINKDIQNPAMMTELLEFFHWCYHFGAHDAVQLHYVPMPDNAIEIIEQTWTEVLLFNGESIWKRDKKV